MGEDVLVFHQHRHIVVVAEDRLEFIGLEQHRVVAHEIVVERSFHHDALRSHKREGDDDCEQRTDYKTVAEYPDCQLLEFTVDFYDFHCCFIFILNIISNQSLGTFNTYGIGHTCPTNWMNLSSSLDSSVQLIGQVCPICTNAIHAVSHMLLLFAIILCERLV